MTDNETQTNPGETPSIDLKKQFKEMHKDAGFHACHLTEHEIAHLRRSIGFAPEPDEPKEAK